MINRNADSRKIHTAFSQTQFLRRHAAGFAYKAFIYTFLLGMSYVLLYPLLIMATKSFRPLSDMYNPSVIWISTGFTMENIQNAMKALDYIPTLILTLRIVTVNTALSLISCSMAGYGLARFRMKLTPAFAGLVIASIIIPAQTYTIPLYLQFVFFDFFGLGRLAGIFAGEPLQISLVNSEFSLYIPNLLGSGVRAGIFILIFMQFFKNLPKELENAARIDGAGEARIFTRIMIPNVKQSFLVVFLFSFVWNWNEYYLSQLLMHNKMLLSGKLGMIRELVNPIANPSGWGDGVNGSTIIFASAILFILPPLFIYIVAQRKFIQSFERSGIVG